MKTNACIGLILMAGLLTLTGCGAHLTHHLAAGRQMPITTPHGGISIPLTNVSEVQLNLRGFRMGLTSQTESRHTTTRQPDLMPWLRYRFHF